MDNSIFQTIGYQGRLVDQVVNEIERLIGNGSLGPGTMLPPQQELADQFGVSRTVIREAVHILVTKGLLESRQGVGTVVRQVSGNQVSQSLGWLVRTRIASLDDLHQVRSILEVENARLAALHARPEEILELKQILAEMSQAPTGSPAFAEKDAEFHTALARMTGNPLMVLLLDSIRDLMQEVRLIILQYPDRMATVMPDHNQIFENIAAKDAEGAARAMKEHLDHARTIQQYTLEQSENELL